MIKEEIVEFRGMVNADLSEILDNFCFESKRKKNPPELIEAINFVKNYILRGGKRLRPFLFHCACVDCSFKEKDVLRISSALEMMHTFFLIHDDIVDRDDIRHGGLSMHKEYEKYYEGKINGFDSYHFGSSMGLLVGDLAASWVYRIILESEIDEKNKIEVMKKVSQIISDTIFGEMIDQTLCVGGSFDEDLILRVHRYKTAKYTVLAPLQLGAILRDASEEELSFISEFSIPLGIAYQIKDDILGVFGEADKIGKPVGSDIKEGKKTLLMSYALDNVNEEDRKTLLSYLGIENINREGVEKVRSIIKESGSLEYSEKKIDDFYEVFLEKLKGNIDFYHRYAFMEEISDLLLKRKK